MSQGQWNGSIMAISTGVLIQPFDLEIGFIRLLAIILYLINFHHFQNIIEKEIDSVRTKPVLY